VVATKERGRVLVIWSLSSIATIVKDQKVAMELLWMMRRWKRKRLPNGDESPILLFRALDAISRSSSISSVAIFFGARTPSCARCGWVVVMRERERAK
jgi:hypothetical protein